MTRIPSGTGYKTLLQEGMEFVFCMKGMKIFQAGGIF